MSTKKGRIQASTGNVEIRVSTGKGRIQDSTGKGKIRVSTGNGGFGRVSEKVKSG